MMTNLLAQLSSVPDVRRPRTNIPDTLVIGGMGGSALGAEALRFLAPESRILIHRDYGIPWEAPADALHIAISYSGNTEETLAFANAALRQQRPLAVVASGGALAECAERESLPLALIPSGLVPRNAFMYMVRALLALVGKNDVNQALASLTLDEAALEASAEAEAHYLLPGVPLFYTSDRNRLLGQMAKLIMNESARTPAFANVFPELNHNEMQSFDTDMPEGLEHLFRIVLMRDTSDHARIVRRMDTFASLMEERGRSVLVYDSGALARTEVLVHSWLRSILAGRLLAETRGINPDTQPLVDAFKKRL